MLNFIQRFGGNILGVLNGFDRIRFRGTRRFLANTAGMMNFLWQRQLLLKDFKAYAAGVNGFRNRDLRKLLFKEAKDEKEGRRQSESITRKLRLLRAHGLIRKMPKSHRYQLSPRGADAINALLAARQTSVAKLAA